MPELNSRGLGLGRLSFTAVSVLLALTPISSTQARTLLDVCPATSVRKMEAGETLWVPERISFYRAEEAERFTQDREIVVFRNAPAWNLPGHPTFDENPFNNRTWKLFYNSLGWLHALIFAGERMDDQSMLLEAKRLIFSFMDHYPANGASLNVSQWLDHPTAYRLANLSQMLSPLAAVLNEEETATLADYLEAHAEYLISLFPNPAFYGHNHGFMDAMAVYSASIAMASHPKANDWRSAARERLSELFGEMFVDVGVSREESLGYHYYAARLMFEAECLSILNNDAPIPSFEERAKTALEFAALASLPDRTMPAIGDTRYAQETRSADKFYIDELTTPISSYILSDGKEGSRPPELTTYREAGYSIFRYDDLHIFFDFSATPGHTHGHNDDLSFTLHQGGKPVIVDPGGPFAYGSREQKEYFNTAHAHNVIVIDGADTKGKAEFISDGTADRLSWVVAKTVLDGVTHERTIITVDGNDVVIRDRLSSNVEHEYRLIFHLPPTANAVPRPETSVTNGDAKSIVSTSLDQAPQLLLGQTSPLRGWVTAKTLSKTEAPTLIYSTYGASKTIYSVIAPEGGKVVSFNDDQVQIGETILDLSEPEPKIMTGS
ncbi:heparinase II/III family protein [Nitratireductor indicus]|uniref:heparinase II/III family protein n=1 Tax=Nitratireductor indicus TaxID=721133 RepID=UPI002876DEA8|nr:alginate lyase family protein [Nitratireductor indicus]MDS1135554.1 alginate lyase family protein [Nitratireductor indicus]